MLKNSFAYCLLFSVQKIWISQSEAEHATEVKVDCQKTRQNDRHSRLTISVCGVRAFRDASRCE